MSLFKRCKAKGKRKGEVVPPPEPVKSEKDILQEKIAEYGQRISANAKHLETLKQELRAAQSRLTDAKQRSDLDAWDSAQSDIKSLEGEINETNFLLKDFKEKREEAMKKLKAVTNGGVVIPRTESPVKKEEALERVKIRLEAEIKSSNEEIRRLNESIQSFIVQIKRELQKNRQSEARNLARRVVMERNTLASSEAMRAQRLAKLQTLSSLIELLKGREIDAEAAQSITEANVDNIISEYQTQDATVRETDASIQAYAESVMGDAGQVTNDENIDAVLGEAAVASVPSDPEDGVAFDAAGSATTPPQTPLTVVESPAAGRGGQSRRAVENVVY